MKEYTGNKKSLFVTLGASAGIERAEQDYYATDPAMALELCKYEELVNVWECACGAGHLAKVFNSKGLARLLKHMSGMDRGRLECTVKDEVIFIDFDKIGVNAR